MKLRKAKEPTYHLIGAVSLTPQIEVMLTVIVTNSIFPISLLPCLEK